MSDDNVEYREFRQGGGYSEGGDGGGLSGLENRVGNLERSLSEIRGDIGGIKHGQTLHLATLLGIGAILLTLGLYTLSRVDALPGAITNIANAVTNAVTASRSQPPPVIVNIPPVPMPKSGEAMPAMPPSDNATKPSDGK